MERPDAYDDKQWSDWYGDKERGVLINSGDFDGLNHKDAVQAVAMRFWATRAWASSKTTWRLRDWGISRQRYWGTPIPIIHCADCGPQPVPEKGPARGPAPGSGARWLPAIPRSRAKPSTPAWSAPAAASLPAVKPTPWTPSWTRPGTSCRYCDAKNGEQMVADGADYWMPMDQYIGGVEHTILHLLYARFWTKVMRDLGLVKIDEPFASC